MTSEINDLTDDELIIVFADEMGRKQALLTKDPPDPERANLSFDRAIRAYRILKLRGPDSQGKLLRLLEDKRPEVRASAGAYALEFAADKAEPVLRALADRHAPDPSGVKFNALITLREWEAGRLKFPEPA